MLNLTYNWKRYWVPREGGFSFDSEGFLLPPTSDADWAKYWKTDVVGIDDMASKPCLVLLGEPGIGKSFAIRDAENRLREKLPSGATILSRDLSGYTTDSLLVEDVFKSTEFLSWQQNGGELHVFLDSFDECLLRVDAVAELLAGQFSRVASVQNLYLRIASRTAEWRTSLEDALRQSWGQDVVGVYELAPLTRDQVLEAAKVQLTEPERFIEQVVENEVVSFAIKPLTLDLLLRVWKARGGSLPPTQREIYEQGCRELCTDSEKRQTPKLRRQLSPEQRLAVASHVAAATFFCNRAAVWTAASPTQKPDSDISLSELATSFVTAKGQRLAVTESVIREALDTGLFTSRGRNRLGWAHQTYGEFLAARYLVQEGLSARQVFDLLTHPHDSERRLIPQLQETAAWASAPGSELFNHLAKVQPDVLLRSDVATADDKEKSALVEALLAAFAQDAIHGDWWGIRKRYRKLRHAGLAAQLRRHLSNRKPAADARIEAIQIAETCELKELHPVLVRLALDASEHQQVRNLSAAVVARSADSKLKKQLRPLALGQGVLDPEHELRGAGLSACWPEHISAEELFVSLPEPGDRHHGVYHSFLTNGLVQKLGVADLPMALAWAEAQPECHDSYDGGYAGLVHRILDRAAEYMDENSVMNPLARALLARLKKHEFSCHNHAVGLIRVLEARPDLRLRLVEAMVPIFADAKEDSPLVAGWGLRLLFPKDLSWLLEKLESAGSPELQKKYACLVNWVFSPDDVERIDAVLCVAERLPVLAEVMPLWLKPLVLDSEEARKAREYQQDDLRRREKREKMLKPKLLSPLPAEKVPPLLDRIETGDLEAWWKLCLWIEIEDDGRYCQKHRHMDIRELVGWKKASDATKARMIAAAERYVCGHSASPEEWFSRRNILYHPAVAGFRALLLLANENQRAFAELSPEVWQQWLPAILRLHCYDESDAHKLLTGEAFRQAPTTATEWTVKVVTEENKEGENLWVLHKLPKKWDEQLGTALLNRLKQGRLKLQCHDQLMADSLKHQVPGAVEFMRSKFPRRVPAGKKSRQFTVFSARLLMVHGERGDWLRVRKLMDLDSAFGRTVIEGFAHDYGRSPAGILNTMSEGQVGELWEWMLAQYPLKGDPDRSRGGEVTTRHSMANLRDSLVSYLGDIGTEAGCRELQRLISKYPMFSWFRRVLLRGQEQTRRHTWQPTAPGDLFQLAANRHARLVQSGDQLLEAIIDSLGELQKRLQGETPLAQFLWDGNKHKPEEAISEWVKVHLEDDLKQRGVVLRREVQIHRFDKTDIHVTALTQTGDETFDHLKVIIEVKGSWHRELKSSMKTQLAERYLKDNDCRHGLYLVAWFPKANQTNGGKQRRQSGLPKLTALENYLTEQAQTLSKDGFTIRPKVIDFSIRLSTAKRVQRRVRQKQPKRFSRRK